MVQESVGTAPARVPGRDDHDPPPPAFLRASLLRDQVTDHIRQEILSMRLRPGQRLVERELMELTGVSRVTIRESIRQLAAEGLVQLVPQKGAVVARMSSDEVLHIWEVRGVLESFAARLFVERASDEQVAEIRKRYDEFALLIDNQAEAWLIYQAKNAYYETLFEGSGNPILSDLANSLLRRVVAARIGYFAQTWPMSISAEVGKIVEAIEARDASAAERAAYAHVEMHGQSSAETIALWLEYLKDLEANGPRPSKRSGDPHPG